MNSGRRSNYKIECDDLQEKDFIAFAQLIADKIKFRRVIGIPRGGYKISKHLTQFEQRDNTLLPLLIVDDVLTTGGSFEKTKAAVDKEKYPDIIGVVLFARGPCPVWVTPILTTNWL